jgi:DNA-directed RNA polymerase subunit E'/Rpb7
MATARMTLFKPVYLDQRVNLTPTEFRDAAADIDGYLLKKIRDQLEGQCCVHGYVYPGNTQILARSMGQAEHGRFTADFIFYCKIRIYCFSPYANQEVDARIFKMNKIGAYALIVENGNTLEAMRILIPRDLHLGNGEFDTLQVGDTIRTRILRSRFQNNDAFIQGVGMYEGKVDLGPVTAAPVAPLRPGVAETEAA